MKTHCNNDNLLNLQNVVKKAYQKIIFWQNEGWEILKSHISTKKGKSVQWVPSMVPFEMYTVKNCTKIHLLDMQIV